jgi:hypothetical protein
MFGAREELATSLAVQRLREPIAAFLSAEHEYNFTTIENLIPLGDPLLGAPPSSRKLSALSTMFREELVDIIAWALLAELSQVENLRYLPGIWEKIVKANTAGEISVALSMLRADLREYYLPANGDTRLFKRLCNLLMKDAGRYRRELNRRALADPVGRRLRRPSRLAFEALILLLAGAFERATGRTAGFSRLPGEPVYSGPFIMLVEKVLAVVSKLGARGIGRFASHYALGRHIERLLSKPDLSSP